MVTYNFEYDEKTIDALAEIRLNTKSEKILRAVSYIILIAIEIYLIISSLYPLYAFFEHHLPFSSGDILTFIEFMIFLIFIINVKRIRRYRLKKALKSQADLLNTHGTWTFSERGIHVSSNLGEGDTYWPSIKSFENIKNYIYIQRKDGATFLIDKDKLSENEISELQDLEKNFVA